MGGFRTGIIATVLTFFIGIAYHSGLRGVFLSGTMCTGGIALLATINQIAPLPPNAQRALTFLPGTWEQRYKDDAEGSTEWRTEVWKEALFTDRWIQNKWVGDGIGFSAAELAAQMNQRKLASSSGFDAHRETVLINGDYHSSFVSSVRTTGYIGALVLILGTARLTIHAHRLIIRNRKSKYFPICLLIGIPQVLALPWYFIGAYNYTQVAFLFVLGCGMTRMLENNLNEEYNN